MNNMRGIRGQNVVTNTKHKIYVYAFNGAQLEFKQCRSIAEAIRIAINFPGSYILCDGKEVKFNILANNKAVYMQVDGKLKTVDIIKY